MSEYRIIAEIIDSIEGLSKSLLNDAHESLWDADDTHELLQGEINALREKLRFLLKPTPEPEKEQTDDGPC